jgi:hypothetical protein
VGRNRRDCRGIIGIAIRESLRGLLFGYAALRLGDLCEALGCQA